MARTATRFVNKTKHTVKVQVGNSERFSEIASIKENGEYKLHVKANDMYREFMVDVGIESGCPKPIVTSDDCCDFECITVEEVNGKVELVRQPRGSSLPILSAGAATETAPASSKKPSWFSWGMWI